jgi:hypothetical protein
MRSDVHTAALRAAAKVAFSVAFIAGCSSADTAEEQSEGTSASTESDINSKHDAACHEASADTDAGPKLSCDQIVAAAFPTEGGYPGKKQSVSSDVQSCCLELLTESKGVLASHRWDCCANLPPSDAGVGIFGHGPNVGIACTPWGPPVPPSMKNRRSRAQTQILEVA